MKAIMVMFDSLVRNYLEPYGGEDTPNFRRLAEKCVTFDTHYCNSLPCMPARRELHTGRCNFLHRSWGPMEPFDDSMPELLRKSGVYTHLISDHRHYWEDGGATYHTRYSSWEVSRGQEGDPWKPQVDVGEADPSPYGAPDNPYSPPRPIARFDRANRPFIREKKDMPQVRTFDKGLEFLDRNHGADRWFLQIETFDPHEPFYVPGAEDEKLDWPPYCPVREGEDFVSRVRRRYKALLKICDEQLGRVLDKMDEYGLWEDTMLLVNTDHGFLLGEHGWWGKSVMPLYEELVHTPLFLYDPRNRLGGVRCSALTENIDLAPTLLDFFSVDIPGRMTGKPLRPAAERKEALHDYALFGIHGGYLNVTDGRYVLLAPPVTKDNTPLFEYTLMPTHMASFFSKKELSGAVLEEGKPWTGGTPVLRIPRATAPLPADPFRFGLRLYDLREDPGQRNVLEDETVLRRMLSLLLRALRAEECPEEQYRRMGLPMDEKALSPEACRAYAAACRETVDCGGLRPWPREVSAMYRAVSCRFPAAAPAVLAKIRAVEARGGAVTAEAMEAAILGAVAPAERAEALYYAFLNARTS